MSIGTLGSGPVIARVVACLSLIPCGMVVGCGTTVTTVNDDPLTKQLGESGVTVQRASEALSPEALQAALTGADLGAVERSNKLVTHLLKYEPQKVDPRDLDDAIEHPDAPYAVAMENQNRWARNEQQLKGALIPTRAYAASPEDVKAFVRHWNDYVDVWRKESGDLADWIAAGIAFKEPTTGFLRRIRDAIRRRDGRAYRAAVEGYTKLLKSAGRGFLDAKRISAALNPEAADQAVTRMVEDANGSDAVSRLVETLRSEYPRSAFADRFKR